MNMKRIYIFISIILGLGSMMSCDDFFKQESADVLYADQEHLNNAVDTVYSVTGILGKLQAVADRTVLLGEVRGDLVSLTTVASNDLRELASFSVSDDNMYNAPSDYYAVINNCNYFIAHADTALKSNRNENIFMKEYCAVKSIRAWTYLQLALNYGQVPFYTEPMLSKEESDAAESSPKADLQTICTYFINDLATLPERYNTEYPGYGKIRGLDSRLFFFPLSLMRGELYLWRASVTGSKEDYRQAALHYYTYINERNGMNSAYPTDLSFYMWSPGTSTWLSTYSSNWGTHYGESSEYFDELSELITLIPGDSIRAEGNYSELRNLFSSREENDYKVSINPSQRMVNISEAQANCVLSNNGSSCIYAPAGLTRHMSGDLRLSDVWDEGYHRDAITNERIETQYIMKHYTSRNVHIYRRMMVYLRMAEALNMAGYPRMAFQILAEGLSNQAIQENVIPYYNMDEGNKSDSLFLARFDFPDTRYGVATAEDIVTSPSRTHNQIGIHTRGSGWTPMNEYYRLPDVPDSLRSAAVEAALVPVQQAYVDSLILNESALEFAFEGTRYYDIMRYAMRQPNPGQAMANIIGARLGEDKRSSMAAVMAKLTDQRNWYINWKGKIGF